MTKPKVYLIGGSPRTGKSTLMHRFLEQQPIMAVSTDAIRYLLSNTEGVNDQRLFQQGSATDLNSTPQTTLERQNSESFAVWEACEKLIESNQEDGLDILIEGVAVLPNLTAQLQVEHQAVFLGDQSDDLSSRIQKAAADNRYDWLRNNTNGPEDFDTYADFFKHMSKWLEKECQTHNQSYFEMRDSHQTAMEAALTHLLS